jgi:hypothetical protein
MRKLVFGTLLVLMPFSGMRVICVGLPTDVSASKARTETGTDCERLCPLHPPSAAPSGSQNGSDCALSSDASSIGIFASIAVPQPQEPLHVPVVVSEVSADAPRFYLEPALAHLGPPPKTQAL